MSQPPPAEPDPYLRAGAPERRASPPRPTPPVRHAGRGRVLSLGLAIALLMAAGAASSLTSGPTRPRHRPPAAGPGGRLLTETTGMSAASVAPTGGRLTAVPRIGDGGFIPVGTSPEGDQWLDADGSMAILSGGRLVLRATPVARYVSPTSSPAPGQPFADAGRAVVVVAREPGGGASASVVDLTSGDLFHLGTVDSAAGDLQSRGAFVSVPDPSLVGADSRLELRRVGRAPVVLANAAQLDGDFGWLPSVALHLGVYPSPTGDAVAVVLEPLNPVSGDLPMVVLDRTGGLLASFGDWSGPMYDARPVWSTGGRQIVFPTYTTAGAALTVTTETGSATTVPAPAATTTFGSCLWSPDSLNVVCQARTGARDQWLFATPGSTRLMAVPAAGPPLAWVTGP